MILELLKSNLSEELYAQVSEALEGKELGQFIPKFRFDEISTANKELKAEAIAKATEHTTELEALKSEFGDYEEIKKTNDQLKVDGYKNKLKEYGIDEGFVDYALGKIDVADFEVNAKKFVEENPKFTAETFKKINSSLDLGGGNKVEVDKLSDHEYVEYRKTHNVDGTEIKNRK